ncbi:MAG: hypothetical protein M3Y87_28130 [Myxococcota bacterium]|nr:hypothetical protein [Myxococcota bacterium]
MKHRFRFTSLALVLLGACDAPSTMMMDGDAGPLPMTTLRTGAPVTFEPVYEATSYAAGGGVTREWLPVDLAVHPDGELWLVQRMERDPAYDDDTECTERGLAGNPSDCVSLQGSTVAITEPSAAEPASEANGRANLVVDANSWHFMRRPSSIAFGDPALPFEPTDPGAADANVTETQTYQNTFATCHEHATGNNTDGGAFIGPSLWTADRSIYNGVNGSFEWSNGSHLDMVHATQYCMGIAYEGANAYWTFNGAEGALDRYDFGAPHYPGHHDHDDGDVTRFYLPEGDELSRLPYVPSNMVLSGASLFVADTGNGRVLRFDIASPGIEVGTFRTFESIDATAMEGIGYQVLADAAVLGAAWGGASEPSGLALLDAETLVVASHATGHITLLELDGTVIRTIDTGTGEGPGGLTVLDGRVYFVQMNERRVYRMDVMAPAAE